MEIGQKVKVVRLRDPLSADMVNKIKKNPVGTIQEFKMVDGQGIGVFVRFDESFTTWFFEDELEPAQ
jgi:hypothetical protein